MRCKGVGEARDIARCVMMRRCAAWYSALHCVVCNRCLVYRSIFSHGEGKGGQGRAGLGTFSHFYCSKVNFPVLYWSPLKSMLFDDVSFCFRTTASSSRHLSTQPSHPAREGLTLPVRKHTTRASSSKHWRRKERVRGNLRRLDLTLEREVAAVRILIRGMTEEILRNLTVPSPPATASPQLLARRPLGAVQLP